MWFPRTAPEKFRIRLPPAVSLRTIGSAVGEPVLASKNLRRPQGSVRDVALCGDRRRRPRDASHQILIGQLVNRDWYLLSECLQGGRIPPSVDSSQATGRVKRRDNQLHRARVLEVRIPLAPADSPSLAGFLLTVSKSRQLPRRARARPGGRVGRDAQGSSTSRQLPVCLCRVLFQYRSAG